MTPNRASQSSESGISQRLPVRVRRTVHGNGRVETSLSTFCRSRGRSVGLEDCLHCADLDGLSIDPAGEDASVRCTAQGAAASAPRRSDDALRAAVGADATPLQEMMTRDVTCVTADFSVEDLTALLLERNISGVPVVDVDGRPIGVVTKTDLLREFSNRGDSEQVEPADFGLTASKRSSALGFTSSALRVRRSETS